MQRIIHCSKKKIEKKYAMEHKPKNIFTGHSVFKNNVKAPGNSYENNEFIRGLRYEEYPVDEKEYIRMPYFIVFDSAEAFEGVTGETDWFDPKEEIISP